MKKVELDGIKLYGPARDRRRNNGFRPERLVRGKYWQYHRLLTDLMPPALRGDMGVQQLMDAMRDADTRAAIYAALRPRPRHIGYDHAHNGDKGGSGYKANHGSNGGAGHVPVLSVLAVVLATPTLRLRFWHMNVHAWCTAAQHACVVAVLVVELRVDRLPEPEHYHTAPLHAPAATGAAVAVGRDHTPPHRAAAEAVSTEVPPLPRLPPLPHDLWLLVMQYVRRSDLGGRS